MNPLSAVSRSTGRYRVEAIHIDLAHRNARKIHSVTLVLVDPPGIAPGEGNRRVEAATRQTGLGVLAITHYSQLLHELRADRVHVLVKGRIAASGGPELAFELERDGYAAYQS